MFHTMLGNLNGTVPRVFHLPGNEGISHRFSYWDTDAPSAGATLCRESLRCTTACTYSVYSVIRFPSYYEVLEDMPLESSFTSWNLFCNSLLELWQVRFTIHWFSKHLMMDFLGRFWYRTGFFQWFYCISVFTLGRAKWQFDDDVITSADDGETTWIHPQACTQILKNLLLCKC